MPDTYRSPAETGLYYLQSRYYDPEICRFISADEIIELLAILTDNMFIYCENNPIKKHDLNGLEGQTIDLGHGWYYRIDPANTSTKTQKHIHIWNDKKEYIQNDDGSPHDKHKGAQGKIPGWINDELIKREGWDYNGNRNDFFKETQSECWDIGAHYLFPDNSQATVPNKLYGCIIATGVRELERIYYNSSEMIKTNTIKTARMITPIVEMSPVIIVCSSWSLAPVPMLF